MLDIDDSDTSTALISDQIFFVIGQAKTKNSMLSGTIKTVAELRRSFVFSIFANYFKHADFPHPCWIVNHTVIIVDCG